MKNSTLILSFALMTMVATTYGQAEEQLNFGLVGVSYEIPVGENVSIAPFAGTNFDLNYLALGVKANYYFDNLFQLPPEWDVYGGANGGYAIAIESEKNSDFDMGLHVGTRWFWNEKWGVYVELGGGSTSELGGGIGVTMKL